MSERPRVRGGRRRPDAVTPATPTAPAGTDGRRIAVTLEPLTRPDLVRLARGATSARLAARTLTDALPPPFVAQRALARLAAGQDGYWCGVFHIVRSADAAVIGGCGFKGAPVDGRVEIGYGVAPACRRRGVATQAVRELVRLAFARADVTAVLAQVNPDNVASTRVVVTLGFAGGAASRDHEGEMLVPWVLRR